MRVLKTSKYSHNFTGKSTFTFFAGTRLLEQEQMMTPQSNLPPNVPSAPQAASTDAAPRAAKISFKQFYAQHFLAEHQHPLNIALHAAGTVAGLVFAAWVLLALPLWYLLLFPVVHALPGLVGHRLVERNAAVGDVRVTRTDFSPLWFIAANHLMTWRLLTRGAR
jgi:hypothetical protein